LLSYAGARRGVRVTRVTVLINHFFYFFCLFPLALQNLSDIITKQQRGKYYVSLKAGKYGRVCKTPGSLASEKEKQNERLQAMGTLVDRVISEYPELQGAFRDITLAIGGYEQLFDTERSGSVREVEVA